MLIYFLLPVCFISGKELQVTLDAVSCDKHRILINDYDYQAETIEYNKYPVERHYVTTDDGYTSEVQRIPFGRDRSLSFL